MDGDPRYGEVKQSDQGHIIGQGWSWEEESGLLIPSLVPPAGCIEGCIWLKKKKKKKVGENQQWNPILRSGGKKKESFW